ncbi:efflux RND transporter periplasmic adaptor subunit [Nostoc sp. FACHB-152]|uniref:efflux RND transporter periplasmic adaptor subunit n=1 Tax=unclassified Nostoc TaxID=2593658 RepID=UPI001686A545|nr:MULTISPECIES: efflux RND transporter periplasmic adaptor subunit [unclassified Nostoc]MBD2445914.1 efflux RND transporter periplasmic adaptor subunit [Nostoc sp. FACHB-152]MBD2467910.1 efflux RND transporter periplasmic adaptor subunit [Nostoc sp. FACHB-145]
MSNSLRFPTVLFVSLLLFASPAVVLAHAGHGNEFSGEHEATPANTSIQVDTETAQRLGIKVEPVKRQGLAVSIKTTGQIETLPSKQVEVTTPIPGAKVLELLVEPGALVKQGQPVAVVSSPDLVSLRVESQEKLAQGQADLQQALADLKLAQQNRDRYQQITTAEIAQAQSQVAFAQEKYDKDKQLAEAGALPQRNALESQTQLTEAKAQLTKANSRREVIEAENQLKRAQAAVDVAKSRISLSNSTYQTRLQQLGIRSNAQGLVTVTAPISGRVADREVTIGQTFNDAGGKLMTLVNDSRVFATANIYEKDLNKVRQGQRVNVKIAALPKRTFTGRITVINSVVTGDTRVVPVKAEINNPGGVLKPGMFAQLEVLTDEASSTVLVIPSAAVVDVNGKSQVYIQNGNAYQAVEVVLGQTSGDMVEVKTGLFEGDLIVTQRAPQLYAQSLRGGSKSKQADHEQAETTTKTTSNMPVPLWLIGVGGGTAVATSFMVGAFWSNRRTRSRLLAADEFDNDRFSYETEVYVNGNQKSKLSNSALIADDKNHRHSEDN